MTTAAIRSDWAGRVVGGRFRLLKWLGGTDWSDVFLTERDGPGSQRAAIKLIAGDTANAAARMALWAAVAQLSHPRLMPLFATGRCQVDGKQMLYSVTEYAEEVLSDVIPERALAPGEVREMLIPVLDALFYLHPKGFVHGHLKPANILVVANHLKLSTDGLEVAGERVQTGVAPSIYDAPEVGTTGITPAADVWSLGATLVEALTQQPPAWERSTQTDPVVPKTLPAPFARIAQECLRVNPAQRCTLTDVNKSRLEETRPAPVVPTQSGESAVAKAQQAGPANVVPTKTGSAKLRMLALIVGALVLLAALTLAYLWSRPKGVAPPVVKQSTMQTAPKKPPAAAKRSRRVPARTARSLVPERAEGESVAGSLGGSVSGSVVKGAVAQRVLPEVPASASATIRGTLRVRVRVAAGADGAVSSATFDSAGPSKYFARLALQAAQGWRFTPAQVAGKAVGSVWVLQFDFRRSGVEVVPIEVTP
ncbi:MAG: TonB family protein [Acidobacteriaceae bacterium]